MMSLKDKVMNLEKMVPKFMKVDTKIASMKDMVLFMIKMVRPFYSKVNFIMEK